MPSASVENYLKAIYHLQGQGEDRVSTNDLAEEIDRSHSSVTSMLQSLADEGLVDYEAYSGARLTEEGIEAALRVIRNHRLIEIFLVKTLDYEWDEVHREAERLEHAVSDKLAERIDRYLGRPDYDPHGDPIPTAKGDIPHSEGRSLDEVEEGERVRIARVLDQDPEVLRHLDKVGLTPDTILDVEEVVSIDGQMSIDVGGEGDRETVSRALASRLLVTEP